ncbi:hypothetical protein [Amycolatopsis minnesotensis]|uniref:Uncharacterized protein n=1 Tax=Amycolatopsis minnesotensis TaxID=337894 RepID=A0ABN2SB85_9PSEU
MIRRLRTEGNRKRMGRLAALTAAATIATNALAAVPASADDPVEFPVSFSVSGSTVVKKTGSAMKLGPGKLDGALIVTETSLGIRGDLSLPTSKADISLVSGLFRIKATVKVVPVGQVTGTLKDGDLNTHTQANMEISDIWAGPIVPIFPLPTVPNSCKTVSPINLDLSAKNVDVFTDPKITVTGSYTIPSFKDCFIADIALGALVSGPGNTISLDLVSNQN